jgi:hypothetical protein
MLPMAAVLGSGLVAVAGGVVAGGARSRRELEAA